MSKIFGGSPKQLPIQPDPSIAREEAARILAEKQAEKTAKGRASTILTGGRGLLDDGSYSRRALFGL